MCIGIQLRPPCQRLSIIYFQELNFYRKFQQSSWSLSSFIFQACETGCLAGRCWPLDHLTCRRPTHPTSPARRWIQLKWPCWRATTCSNTTNQIIKKVLVRRRSARLALMSWFACKPLVGWAVTVQPSIPSIPWIRVARFIFFRQVVALGCIFIACKVEGSWNDSTSTGWLKKKVLRKKVAHDRQFIISVCKLVVIMRFATGSTGLFCEVCFGSS